MIMSIFESLKNLCEVLSGWIKYSGMVKANALFRCRRSIEAVPGIQTDVMVISAGGYERRLVAVSSDQIKAQESAIEIK
jgi:hypothetical protein